MPKAGERWSLLEHCKQDDDLLSYLFVDLGLFRKRHDKDNRITRKFNRDEFSTNASVVWDSYLDILRMVKMGDLSPREGSHKLLRKGTIKTHLQRKRGDPEYNHLVAHVDRYMELWRPDSPFKLFETTRYKPPLAGKGKGKAPAIPEKPGDSYAAPDSSDPSVPEDSLAASVPVSPASSGTSTPRKKEYGPPLDLGVRSLKAYKVHEHLRLFGSAADITSEEDQELQMDQAQLQADFSVIYNPSKHCSQLFLGPGRFVNHDCNPNVELIRSGNRLCFKVLRPIEPNDEILTFYGAEYFGPGNENCLCLTCKKNKKGAYKKSEKPGKKSKLTVPEDPTARRTRSGQQPAKVPSLRKQVHKANLARTTVTIRQGSRRSERAQTQLASTFSISQAREANNDQKRKHSDFFSSSESEVEDDVSYGSKRKDRGKKAKRGSKGKKKASAGSDSSLTDVEDLDDRVTIETVTMEETIVRIEEESSDAAAPVGGSGDDSDHTTQARPMADLSTTSIHVVDGDVPSPLSGTTPRDYDCFSPTPSESIGESTNPPDTPSGFTVRLGEQLSFLGKGAESVLYRALPIVGLASNTASQSQSSVLDTEEVSSRAEGISSS